MDDTRGSCKRVMNTAHESTPVKKCPRRNYNSTYAGPFYHVHSARDYHQQEDFRAEQYAGASIEQPTFFFANDSMPEVKLRPSYCTDFPPTAHVNGTEENSQQARDPTKQSASPKVDQSSYFFARDSISVFNPRPSYFPRTTLEAIGKAAEGTKTHKTTQYDDKISEFASLNSYDGDVSGLFESPPSSDRAAAKPKGSDFTSYHATVAGHFQAPTLTEESELGIPKVGNVNDSGSFKYPSFEDRARTKPTKAADRTNFTANVGRPLDRTYAEDVERAARQKVEELQKMVSVLTAHVMHLAKKNTMAETMVYDLQKTQLEYVDKVEELETRMEMAARVLGAGSEDD